MNFEAIDNSTETNAIMASGNDSSILQHTRRANDGFWAGVGKYVGSLPTQIVDDTAASLGLSDPGDFNNFVTRKLDMPGWQTYMSQNREGLQIGSGVAGLMLSELAVTKIGTAIKEGTHGLNYLPGMKKMAQLDDAYQAAMAGVKDKQGLLLAQGFNDVDILTAKTVINGRFVNMGAEVRKAKWLGVADTTLHAAATEGLFTLLNNENTAFFSDSNVTNISFAAAGIVLPGVASWLQTGAQLKRFMLSDGIAKVSHNFYDPASMNDLIGRATSVNPFQRTAMSVTDQAVMAALKDTTVSTQAYFSDLATANLIQRDARKAKQAEMSLTTGSDFANQRQQLERLATGNEAAAFDYLERVVHSGLGGAQTKFIDHEGIKAHVRYSTRIDAASWMGTEAAGVIPEGQTALQVAQDFVALQQTKVDKIDGLIQLAIAKPAKTPQAQAARLNRFASARKIAEERANLTPLVLRNGEWVDVVSVAHTDALAPIGKIDMQQATADFKVWELLESKTNRPTNIGIGTDGVALLPNGRKFSDLTHGETLGWFRAANSLIDTFVKGDKVFDLPANPSWQILDMAQEIERRSERPGKVNWGMMRGPDGVIRPGSKELAAVQSFQFKALELPAFARRNPNLPDFLLRERFNLPHMTAAEGAGAWGNASSVDRILRGMNDPRIIGASTEAELLQGINGVQFAENLFANAPGGLKRLTGNTFQSGLDDLGNPITPIMGFKRSMNAGFFTRDSLEMRLAMGHAQRLSTLTRQQASPLVRDMSRAFMQSPDVQVASAVEALHPAQRQATLPFFGGQVADSTAQYGDFLDRYNKVMLAARRNGQVAGKMGEAAFDSVLAPHVATFSHLRTRDAAASAYLVDRFISARAGWELDGAQSVVAGPKGIEFQLAQSEGNKNAWFNRFGSQMPNDARLVDVKGQIVSLDQEAHAAVLAHDQMFNQLRVENNTILRARGLPEVERIPYYVPPQDAENKFVAFAMDPGNKVRYTISADTRDQLERLINDLNADTTSPTSRPGWSIRPQDSIKDFNSLWERAHTDFRDPSIQPLGIGKVRVGARQSPVHEFGAQERVLAQLRAGFNALGRDTLETIMTPSLQRAQINGDALRRQVANVTEGGQARKISTESRSIYDDYQNAILNRNPLFSKGSKVRGAYSVGAGFMDRGAAWLSNAAFPAGEKMKQLWHGDSKSEFENLTRTVADQLPFRDVDAYLSQKFGTRKLMDSSELTGKLANFTATMMLRVFGTAQAVMNMSGVLAMMPAVMRGFTPREGETVAQVAERLGYSAHVFTGPQSGKPFTALNMPGLMAGAFKDAWHQKSHPEFDFAMRRGLLSQEVAEMHRGFTQLRVSDDWTKYISGRADGKTFMERHGVIGAASWLSDKSEDFTRAWSHFAGLRVADVMGLQGREARHGFAHDFANQVIANYNPTNRPEIFQGPVGNVIGLFQSYMWNYWGNIFKAVENREYARLATQMMGQASFFGLQTVPGFQQMNDFLFDRTGGQVSPLDAMYAKLDPSVASVVMSGVPSSIPILFGSDNGVALYTRGDTNVRLPGIGGLPQLAVAQKIAGGLGEMMDIFSSENPKMTGLQFTEALSHMIPNREISGMIANFAGEGQTDSRGNLIGEGLDAMKVVATTMGLKTLQDAKMTEAFYMNKREQELQAGKREILLRESRALIRAGETDQLPAIYNKYLETGGDPRRFKAWVKKLYESALQNRSTIQLKKTLDNPEKMSQTMRMLDATGGSDSTEGPDAP